MQGLFVRELLGYRHERVAFGSWLEPPRPELTLMIDLDGAITANGGSLPDAWIGGLSDTYTIVGVGGTFGAIDLKLTPLGAYALLGMPLSELTGQCVALADVLGPEAVTLVEQLREPSSWDARFDRLEAFLAARLKRSPTARRPDATVIRAWGMLCAADGRVRIQSVADELGVSRRYLSDAFARQVGLGPKAVARQLRFAEVRRRIEAAPRQWAQIAYEAGYADQSHLNREFRELAGITPTGFVSRLMPGGGLVGDGCGPA